MKRSRSRFSRTAAVILSLAMVFSSLCYVGQAQAASKKVKKLSFGNPPISTLALKKGEKFKLKPKVEPKSMAGKLKYSSGKKSVVQVNKKGVLKAKKAGQAVITVSSKTKPVKKLKIKVTVYKKFTKAKKVTMSAKEVEIAAGNTSALKASVATKKATVKKVVYMSSDTSVATVSQKGVVSAKKEGTAKITAYAGDGRGAKASCTVKVGKASSDPSAGAVSTPPPGPTVHPMIANQKEGYFTVAALNETIPFYLDKKGKDYDGLSLIAEAFIGDVSLATKKDAVMPLTSDAAQLGDYAVIAGSIGNNDIIDSLIEAKKLDVSAIQGKRECYRIQIVESPVEGMKKAIVVAGSDKRGTIYGIFHISELMGVSPWVYWADVTPAPQDVIYIKESDLDVTSKEPSVRFRGIFLNDEAPSLSSWTKKKFKGKGFNENFYANVFELILRCKGNYLWPAMWNNVFSEDGKSKKTANAELADKYGIVMGTSHHEPLCRAGNEWGGYYNKYIDSSKIVEGKDSKYYWDFNKFPTELEAFWRDGVDRNKAFENLYTIGMRGEQDSELGGTVKDNIDLLKNIITTQKKILADNNLADAPTVLTIYKEVENFWHGTSEVEGLKKWDGLDDTIIMLCDDNFGNMRTLPTDETINRPAGWGMYYHFDYHGGPTSYEWVNTVQMNKTWEQMTMAYEHGIDDVWIVNVGDLKPMEINISYFLDLAYDYETWGKNGRNKTDDYLSQWMEKSFGWKLNKDQLQEVKSLYDEYTWLNGSCKPEALAATTYNATNYNEAQVVLARVNRMIERAEKCKSYIPAEMQASFFQLFYFPTVASANVAKMQICANLNKYFEGIGSANANMYAKIVEDSIALDKQLKIDYNQQMPGVGDKWNGMMNSPHVGFVSWNSDGWSYPKVKTVNVAGKGAGMSVTVQNQSAALKSGSCTLDDFTNIGNESYTVTVANTGETAFDYTVAGDDWIKVSKKTGHVEMQDTFDVSVDWSKVSENKSGKLTLSGAGGTVEIKVNAKVYNTSGLQEKTYMYTNGCASILPGNYVNTGAGKNGTVIDTIKNYGKTGEMMKAFPTNADVSDNAEDAAYADYLVWVDKAGTYKLTAYTGPSNNISRDSTSIYFGLSVNGGETTKINTLDEKTFAAGEWSGSWQVDVKNNGRTKQVDVTLKEGVNTIRIYAVDPTFLLQKLVISEKAVKASHLGPQESYYVGKK